MTVKSIGEMRIEGYALVFDKPSRNFGNFVEIIDRSALDNCNLENVALVMNHEMSKLLARTIVENSLQVEVDDIGLRFSAEIIDTDEGINAFKLVQRGILNKMSYGFFENEDKQKVYRDPKYGLVRRVMEITEIYEISLVAIPAYDQTEAKAKQRSQLLIKEYLNEQALVELEIYLIELESLDY